MKNRAILLLLAVCLLLAGCGKAADDPAAPTAEPTAAAGPTAAPETPSPELTAEPTPEPTAAPRFTVGEETPYVLCEGRSDGAKALSVWLRSSGKDVAESFVPDGLDAPMYTLASAERAGEELPAPTDETRIVRVAADTELLESGILSAWLPAFESATGFIAEVYAGDTGVLETAAADGTADVLLIKKADASAFGTMRQYPLRYDLVTTVYSFVGEETS